MPVQFTCKLVTDDAGGDGSMLVDEIKSSRTRSELAMSWASSASQGMGEIDLE